MASSIGGKFGTMMAMGWGANFCFFSWEDATSKSDCLAVDFDSVGWCLWVFSKQHPKLETPDACFLLGLTQLKLWELSRITFSRLKASNWSPATNKDSRLPSLNPNFWIVNDPSCKVASHSSTFF